MYLQYNVDSPGSNKANGCELQISLAIGSFNDKSTRNSFWRLGFKNDAGLGLNLLLHYLRLLVSKSCRRGLHMQKNTCPLVQWTRQPHKEHTHVIRFPNPRTECKQPSPRLCSGSGHLGLLCAGTVVVSEVSYVWLVLYFLHFFFVWPLLKEPVSLIHFNRYLETSGSQCLWDLILWVKHSVYYWEHWGSLQLGAVSDNASVKGQLNSESLHGFTLPQSTVDSHSSMDSPADNCHLLFYCHLSAPVGTQWYHLVILVCILSQFYFSDCDKTGQKSNLGKKVDLNSQFQAVAHHSVEVKAETFNSSHTAAITKRKVKWMNMYSLSCLRLSQFLTVKQFWTSIRR